MKAIPIDNFVSSVSQLTATVVPAPKPTTPTSLRIRITHASLTHVDLLYAQGLHQNNRRHAKPPFILGTEFAGTVLSAPATSSFQPGSRVFGAALGSYAEEICVDEASVRRVPDGWSNAEACAVGVSAAVSWGALVDAGGLKRGETVLVLGASGGLGVAAVQVALALGAKRVIGLVGDAHGEKAAVVRRLGAEVVGYRAPGWEKRVLELTGGKGVHVVYDSVGAVESGLRCLTYRGRVVVVGFAGRQGLMEMVPMNKILLKAATVVGYRFGEQSRRAPGETETIWAAVTNLISRGEIKPVVYQERYAGLESVPRAMDDVKARRVWGRAIITVSEESQSRHEAAGEQSRL